MKRGRRHADDLPHALVDLNGPADDVRIRTESRLPQIVTDDNDGIRTLPAVFRLQSTSKCGLDAERFVQARGRRQSNNSKRLTFAEHCSLSCAVTRQVFKRRLSRREINEVADRN